MWIAKENSCVCIGGQGVLQTGIATARSDSNMLIRDREQSYSRISGVGGQWNALNALVTRKEGPDIRLGHQSR